MSTARAHQLNRRRRSLTILGLGSLLLLLLALTVGGTLLVIAATVGTLTLAGYLNFLRAQSRRDRDRQEHRRGRAAMRETYSY